jgi:DNA-binding NarL/FixJ family response regulator
LVEERAAQAEEPTLLRPVGDGPWPGDRAAATRVRALIVDDSPLERAGLRAFLTSVPDIDVVGEASSAEDALDAVQEVEPDVVVIDARAPGIERFARRPSWSQHVGMPPVVVLTSSALDDYLAESVGAASSAVPKHAPPQALIEAVRAVARGDGIGTGDDRRPWRPEPLTEREREVLALVVRGLSNQEIGRRLYVSLNTVKTHTKHIYMKLGVRGRQHLIVASEPRRAS